MGFLDTQERVIDMVLTDEGRRQLASNELRFAFFCLFDDGVDYDPSIASSSLSAEQLSSSLQAQIEATPRFEALSGIPHLRLCSPVDGVNVRSRLFTAPQGQQELPVLALSPATASATIRTTQLKREEATVSETSVIGSTDVSFVRAKTSELAFSISVDGSATADRFKIVVLSSGSDGLRTVDVKRDDVEALCYGAELRLTVDRR